MHILTPQEEDLLTQERKLLSDLRVALLRFDADDADQKTLEDSIQQLDDFFLIVLVGEFNAGKSTVINALLGDRVLQVGVTPTTTRVHILRHAEEQTRRALSENLHQLTAPVDLLLNLSIVDTPGTNAIIREHELITANFVPRADLVLFVTSADRPFSESERAFLQKIRDWGKKVVIVLNKVDILDTQSEVEQVQKFIEENARSLLGITPAVYPISARLGLRAKQGEPQLWEESRLEPLENYVRVTLDESSRTRLKFLNPLGVAESLIARYLEIAQNRLSLLAQDLAVLNDVESQLSVYETDMERDFAFRMSDIEKILYEMEQRGEAFFEETIRLTRMADLIKKERIQNEFERKVVADVPHRIESRVEEMIDWLVESDLRQWQAVNEHLAERRRQHKDRIVGDPGVGSFHYDRERLLEGVGREARRVVEGYDRNREARLLAEGVQSSVAAAAVLEIGAVGLGVLISTLATTVAVDVTGILLASFIALVGFFVIPARRRQAKNEMRAKVSNMREKLVTALRDQFEREIERSVRRIHETTAPYTRFVRAEREKLETTRSELERFKLELNRIRVQIEET